MTTPYVSYWAKANKQNLNQREVSLHLLAYHLLDVAAVGYVLLQYDRKLLRRLSKLFKINESACHIWIVFLLGLHDIGKYSHTFQKLRPDILPLLQELGANINYQESGIALASEYNLRHDALGALLFEKKIVPFVETKLQEHYQVDEKDLKLVSRWLNCMTTAIMGHHGKPYAHIDDKDVHLRRRFTQKTLADLQMYIEDWASLLQLWSQNYPSFIKPVNRQLFQTSSWDLAGFVVLCDWIGSSSHFPYRDKPIPLKEYWKEFAIPQAENALCDFGVIPAEVEQRLFRCKDLFSFDTPSPLQKWAEDLQFSRDTPQLIIVEDATGAGKTEAALLIANRLMAAGAADGLFFALPTMATANAMHRRLEKHYKALFTSGSRPSLVLAHGASSLSNEFRAAIKTSKHCPDMDYDTNEPSVSSMCTEWLADSNRKAFLADIGVGTIDQALSAVLRTKFQSLRLFGMTRKVLIVDEVHANDSYMHRVLENVLEAQSALGGSAILLSATLPRRMRDDLIQAFQKGAGSQESEPFTNTSSEELLPYPLITRCDLSSGKLEEIACESRSDISRSIIIKPVHSSEDVYKLIIKAVESGECVCWIRNTVQDARDAYSELSAALTQEKVMLFHARYAMCDRLRRENTALSYFGKESGSDKRRGRVLVATQVVEQSLDVDFDTLITDLAPMDLLIQRIGRARRHIRDAQGNRLPSGSHDQRGTPIVYLHTPPLDEEITMEWFSSRFKRASRVYPNHALLWRTAQWLSRGFITIPADARTAIESTYSQDIDDIPDPLTISWNKTYGEQKANATYATYSVIEFTRGYTATSDNWRDDTKVRTRLGEESSTLRLAKWIDGHIIPWADDPYSPWELSQVSILSSYINEEHNPDGIPIEKAKESMHDRGRYAILVVLRWDGKRWTGTAAKNNNEKSKLVSVVYDEELGLLIE